MRTFWQLALVLAVPAISVSAAESTRPSVPQGTTVKLILLRHKSVQDELKLGEADVKKIREFTDKEYDEMEKAMKLGKEERRKKFKELGEKNKKFLKENLKPEQIKRLNQITMQCTALMQLRRPSVIKALKLTREQRRKINKLRREAPEKLSTFLYEKDRQ